LSFLPPPPPPPTSLFLFPPPYQLKLAERDRLLKSEALEANLQDSFRQLKEKWEIKLEKDFDVVVNEVRGGRRRRGGQVK